METVQEPGSLDFARRFQRSQGRSGRIFNTNAKVTKEEQQELDAAAKANGQALGEWSREVLLRAARGFTPDPTFTELIAMRRLFNSVLRIVACGERMTPESFNAEMQEIRQTKHKAAAEVIQQYAIPEGNK